MNATPGDTLLETISPSGAVPSVRIKDARSAREIYDKLRKADEESARNRAVIDAMMAGEPPYDSAQLVATGQGARTNVNFGEAESLLISEMSGYVDLLASVETLVNFKTRYGTLEERAEYELTISEELTRMLRGWGDYDPNWLLLATHFVTHGVGVAYFENDLDWQWRVGSLTNFLIPRRTRASENDIEVACFARTMQAQQLFKFIEDEKYAKDVGWDVAACKAAIQEAMSNTERTNWTNWEDVVKEMKCNDLHVGIATASEIKIVHVWNVEFDGRVTHSIILEDAGTKQKDTFLYQKVGKFARMGQAVTVFTYGVGVNGLYHGIRGLGSRIFTEVQTSNRLRCQMIDGALLNSSVILQPGNEEALQNLQLTYFGPYTILSSGVEIVERAIPNMSNSVVPVLDDMSRLINSRTTGSVRAADTGAREKTKYEVKSEQSGRARLSSSALVLFYGPLDRLFREVVRRVCRQDYLPGESGGQAVAEFRRRCFERGVPLEAIFQVDLAKVTATRAIGAGSEEMRQLMFDEFAAIAPALDEYGRQNLLRDRVASRIGYQNADRYIQKPTAEARPLMDEKFARMENASLVKEEALPVYPNDNHRVHSRVHIEELSAGVQSINSGQADLANVIPGLVTLLEHTTGHVELMGADPMLQEEAAANRQALQQITETVVNGQKHIEKLRRQEARQMEQGDGQPPSQGQLPNNAEFDVKLRNRLAEHAAKLQMMKEQSDLKLSLAVQDAQQKLALRDAEIARKLSV